jgi:hypothetical protein
VQIDGQIEGEIVAADHLVIGQGAGAEEMGQGLDLRTAPDWLQLSNRHPRPRTAEVLVRHDGP